MILNMSRQIRWHLKWLTWSEYIMPIDSPQAFNPSDTVCMQQSCHSRIVNPNSAYHSWYTFTCYESNLTFKTSCNQMSISPVNDALKSCTFTTVNIFKALSKWLWIVKPICSATFQVIRLINVLSYLAHNFIKLLIYILLMSPNSANKGSIAGWESSIWHLIQQVWSHHNRIIRHVTSSDNPRSNLCNWHRSNNTADIISCILRI